MYNKTESNAIKQVLNMFHKCNKLENRTNEMLDLWDYTYKGAHLLERFVAEVADDGEDILHMAQTLKYFDMDVYEKFAQSIEDGSLDRVFLDKRFEGDVEHEINENCSPSVPPVSLATPILDSTAPVQLDDTPVPAETVATSGGLPEVEEIITKIEPGVKIQMLKFGTEEGKGETYGEN